MDDCYKIRNLLADNGFPELKNVSISEMFEHDKKSSFCSGYAHTKPDSSKETYEINNIKYISVIPESVKIRMRNNNKPIKFINIIPTLIHELAHCVSKIEHNTITHISEFHGEEFYKKFAELLRVSEKLGIYKITFLTNNKFSMASLLKLDKLYIIDSNSISIGSSDLFKEEKNTCNITLNIQNKGKKTIIWNKSDNLYHIIAKKIGTTKKFICRDKNNDEIDMNTIKHDIELFITT